MLGYETYLEKSMNSIKTITDGFTIISNGDIKANNITGNEMDISEIRSNIISSASGIFTNVQNRFTELELDISNIGTGIEILQQDVSNNKISIQQNITDINLIETDISNNIKPDILTNENNISLLITDVSNNKINIQQNATDIGILETDVSNNKISILNNQNSISSLITDVSNNKINIATNSSNLSNHISNYNTFVTNTNNMILDIQTDISSNVTNINTLQADLTTAETNIDNLENNKANRSGDTFTGAVIMNSSLRVQGNLRLDNTTNIYSERNTNYFQGTTTTRRLRINYNEIQFTNSSQNQTFRITNTGDLEYSGLTFNKTLWDTTISNLNLDISNNATNLANHISNYNTYTSATDNTILDIQGDISNNAVNLANHISNYNTYTSATDATLTLHATNIATNATNISTNTNSINTLQNSTLPSTYAKLVANNNFVGNNTFTGLTNLTPVQCRVNDVFPATPIYSSNHFGWLDDGKNYLNCDTNIGGRLNVSFDGIFNQSLGVGINITAGGTIITNSISNNGSVLNLTASSGLNIVGTTTINNSNFGVIPPSQSVNGTIGTPTYVGNLLPNSADSKNYLGPDTLFGGDVNIAYDLEVNGNISNNGTIFTNTISNNSTALTITSGSGLTINANTTVSGDLVVTNNTILSNASATSSLSTPLLTLGTLPITETYFKNWTRPLILGVWYSRNQPFNDVHYMTCSVVAIPSPWVSSDEHIFLERGVKMVGYKLNAYTGGITYTLDNTNGTTPQFYDISPKNDVSSYKIYYYNVEITYNPAGTHGFS